MEIGKKNSGNMAAFAALGMVFLLMGMVSANGELSVTNLVISPQPVLAGQNFTLSFQLYNSYGTLQNVNFGLTGSYPLLNYSPVGSRLISSMNQGLYGGVGTYFLYHLSVPKNVQSGTYTLYVSASYLIQTSSSGTTVTQAATSNVPISFYISGVPNLVLTANPVTQIVPGSQSSINLNVFNSGTASATNINLTVLNSANFTVSGSPTFNLGTINGGASSSAVATLQTNSTLQEGQNLIPVRLQYTTQYGANVSKVVMVPMSVIINQPNIVPSIIATSPQTLYAGSNQTLSVSIQNIGLGVAKNVTVKFLSTNSITVGSSAAGIFIGTIPADSSITQSVFISASKTDNQTNYSVPVEVSYSSSNYQSVAKKTLYLNVTLQKSAIYNITNVSGKLSPSGTYLPLTFTVRNAGGQTAQQITFSMQSIYPIVPASPNVYLKQLAPGESANVTFYVNVDAQGNPGSYPVTVYEQWSQPNGASSQQYSASQNYYAVVSPQGGGSGIIVNIVIGVAVIAIAGYILWRRMPQKNAKLDSKKPAK
ncbi:MAG: COG1361 S-layer family protein [Candidatus Micrarchaeota archaeon]|nr:COG1361 S-layer family protein [Candidatus Micrarchaeota archaeon]